MIDKILKWVTIVALLALVWVLAVLEAQIWAYTHCDPYWIDYDAPGIDITSEGP